MVLVCWDCVSKNPPLCITVRWVVLHVMNVEKIRPRNYQRILGMICYWSPDCGVPEQREIRDVQVAEFFGMKYLRDGGRTSRESGAVEAARWIKWCGSLERSSRLLGHASLSSGSIFHHYSYINEYWISMIDIQWPWNCSSFPVDSHQRGEQGDTSEKKILWAKFKEMRWLLITT